MVPGTIVNRTYGSHENLYIPIFTNHIWFYLLWSPVIVVVVVVVGKTWQLL